MQPCASAHNKDYLEQTAVEGGWVRDNDCLLNNTNTITYGGPQLSHQNKMLTSNSNHSQQIQITHSRFKSLTANSNCSQQIQNHSQQITNPPQQITNRSHQIQIAHSKYKSLTANTNPCSKYKYGQCKTKTSDCGLQTKDQGKEQTEGKMQTTD